VCSLCAPAWPFQARSAPPWPMRRYHNVTVFDGKLFVLAGIGDDGSSDKSDVWYSSDGETWTDLPSTPWAARHAASVYRAGRSPT